jgi:hypothetical protein
VDIDGNAGFALDLRQRLELLQARNIDMKHLLSLAANSKGHIALRDAG